MMTGRENNSSSGGLSKGKPIAAVGASLTRSSTPVSTQRPRKRVSQQFSESTAKSKTNIRWSDELLDKLANAIARDYVQYKTGNKIGFGQKWAAEIGVTHLDESGECIKSKVTSMVT